MPLYVRRRPDTGALEISGTVTPAGARTGVRVRRRAGSNDPKIAREEAAALEREILRTAWLGERPAVRGFAEAVVSYLKHEERSRGTKALLRRLVVHFRDTPLSQITQEAVDKARDVALRPGASPATVKRNLVVPLRSVLLHASRRGWCDRPAFESPRERKGRTAFLLPGQVEALIEGAAPHLQPLLRFLICTGCRVGEALQMEWDQVDLQGARAILWEGETKGMSPAHVGGDRRVVALTPAAVAVLAGLPHRAGRVFRTARKSREGGFLSYRATDGVGGQLRTAWATACRKAGLPGEGGLRARSDRSSHAETFRPEHTPHVLRHTWASWHYALHRDLLMLKQEGGWSSVELVERYAHLMPAGQEAAIRRVWGIMAPSERRAESA